MTPLEKKIAEMEAELQELKAECAHAPLFPETVAIPHRSYEMGKYPVTFQEYDRFCEATDREKPGDGGCGRGRHPVVNVSYHDVQAFIAWLNDKSEDSEWEYFLPTEDEWEYCCADHKEANEEIAHYNASHPIEVGQKKPNKFGLYDMLGNVLEWTSSPWKPGR